MADTPAAPRRRKSSLDLAVVLLLVIGLTALTMLVGRSSRKAGEAAPAALATPTAEDRFVLPEQIGYTELAPLAFQDKLRAIAVGPADHLFVSAGFFIAEVSPEGKELRRIEVQAAVNCLAVSADRLYLGHADHIEVVSLADGSHTPWASLGADAMLSSVAVGQDTVFGGDAGRRRFLRWKLDGTLLGEVNPADPQNRQVAVSSSVPSTYFDVAAAADGTFWATEPGQFGLVHFSADGTTIGRFGKGSPAIEDFGGCCNPTQVATVPGDLLVTVEKKPDLVKTYHADGTFACVVAGPKAFQAKTFVPDVAADSHGRVMVVDPKAKAVRIFEPKAGVP
jgi:hypothetical protein